MAVAVPLPREARVSALRMMSTVTVSEEKQKKPDRRSGPKKKTTMAEKTQRAKGCDDDSCILQVERWKFIRPIVKAQEEQGETHKEALKFANRIWMLSRERSLVCRSLQAKECHYGLGRNKCVNLEA